MLARLEQKLPSGDVWRYEPKLDGFRGLLWRRTATSSQLLSRNLRDLGPWFPEILRAASRLPVGTLVDGEIVICDESGAAEFGRLQARLSTARTRVRALVREDPAVLVVFDVLEHAGVSLASQTLAARRQRLEAHLTGIDPCLQVVAQTDNLQLARDWLSLPQLEGVVAKRADRPYASGRTGDWVKVKRHRTVDCAVVGVAGDMGAPKLVLALRHADDQLHHLGRLGGVICHFERTRNLPLQPCQRLLRCEGAQ
jgi:ATP-dependent DNA ligase